LNKDRKRSADSSVEQIVVAKRRASDRFNDVVYAAERANLNWPPNRQKRSGAKLLPFPGQND
jgi:hypothetical protein